MPNDTNTSAAKSQDSEAVGLLREGAILVRSMMHDLRVTTHITGVVGGGYVSSRDWLARIDTHLTNEGEDK